MRIISLKKSKRLTSKSIKGLSLTFQGVDNVHGSNSLTTSVLGVGDRVPDDVLKEDLEDTTSLLVDETRDTLDTATTSETANGGLGDALDVIAKDLAMTLCASLSESFSSFSAARHDWLVFLVDDDMNRYVDFMGRMSGATRFSKINVFSLKWYYQILHTIIR